MRPAWETTVGQINRDAFARAATNLKSVLQKARPSRPESRRRAEPASQDPFGAMPPGEAAALLDEMLDDIIACAGADKGNIQFFEASTGKLHILAQRGFSPAFLKYFAEVRAHQGACGLAQLTQGSVVVSDVTTSPIFSEEARLVVLQDGIRAVQSVSLASSTARKVGVVSVHYRRPGVPADGQSLLRTVTPSLSEVVALCAPRPGADRRDSGPSG
jgi:hypothetical protein